MELISNKDEVLFLLQKIKQAGSFITNFFIDNDKLSAWIADKQFFYIEAEEGVLFLRQDRNFYHLYYSTNSLGNLSTLLANHLPNKIFVTDIIGKTADVDQVTELFSGNGFTTHTVLERYTRINKENSDYYQPENEVEIATDEYSAEITEMLQKNFDKYSEQVYSFDEVRKLVHDVKIIMIRDVSKIKGILIRSILPQSSVLNNFLVNPEFLGQKIGSKLLKHYIFESKFTKRMWLWVIRDNEHAINMYQKHGYTRDGLVDAIMILNKENGQNS